MKNWLLLPPCYTRGGRQRELQRLEENVYEDKQFRVTLQYETVDDNCVRLVHYWKNIGKGAADFQPEIRMKAGFPYTHYVIPGVSYNGNHWGNGKEPKGLEREGQPWVFDYRRTTIPGCTISENADQYAALMASDREENSLLCSCSMTADKDGCMIHRLLYPTIEKPLTYCSRDRYSDAYETFIHLEAGEEFRAAAYLLSGKPEAPAFAAANVEDTALWLLGRRFPFAYPVKEVQTLSLSHALHLLSLYRGRQMFHIGMSPEKGSFVKRDGFAFGWCGQNGMYARLCIQKGLQEGKQELVDIGMSNLDAWAEDAVAKTGLLVTEYEDLEKDGPVVVDTCNQGFAVMELLKAYRLLKAAGIERTAYYKAAEGAADFFVEHYSPDYGFGKAWDVHTGDCVDQNGTIGAYLIPGLVDLYEETGRQCYLNRAKEACRLYYKRDLAGFFCTAGALDTYCIDKETSGPMLIGALRLFELEKSGEWLNIAKKAGWYFCSWMMHYDTIPEAGSDFETAAYHTLGGTTVSAQHHHMDPWGALVVPALFTLYRITGDINWKRRAQLIWANAIQNIAPAEGKLFHGLWRHPGAQNEGYCQCRWGVEKGPGEINDWLVAWPQAFCLNAAMELTDAELQD